MWDCPFKMLACWKLPITVDDGGGAERHPLSLSLSGCFLFLASPSVTTFNMSVFSLGQWANIDRVDLNERRSISEMSFSPPLRGSSASRRGSAEEDAGYADSSVGAPGGCRGLPSTQTIFFHLFPLSTPVPPTAAAINSAACEPSIPPVQTFTISFHCVLFFQTHPASLQHRLRLNNEIHVLNTQSDPDFLPKLVSSPTQ